MAKQLAVSFPYNNVEWQFSLRHSDFLEVEVVFICEWFPANSLVDEQAFLSKEVI
jgi:hypothetical protein